MEEVRFDSEILNKFMAEKTGKESFTKDEVRKELMYMELDLQGEKMTQEDANLLVEILSKLNITNADLSDVKLRGMEISEVKISDCNLPEDFFAGSVIDSINLGNLRTGKNVLEDLSKVERVRKLSLDGDVECDYDAILKDYPDFYELDALEEFNIMKHYEKNPKIDISMLNRLKGLEEVEISQIELVTNNICIPEIKTLRSLSLDKCIIHSLDIISQQKSIKNLMIWMGENVDIDTMVLKEFTELENLGLCGMNGVENNLPFSNNMQSISLNDCGIKDANKILALYPQLMQMNLNANPLTSTSIEDMQNSLVSRKINVSFKDSELYQKLKSKIVRVENAETEKKLKEFLSVEPEEDISLYDFIACSYNNINDAEVLNEIVGLGVEKEALKDLKRVNIDCFQQLSEKAQEYLMRCAEIKIEFDSLEGLTSEKLEKFCGNNITFQIKGDSKIGGYTPEELMPIVKVMEQIKSQIPKNANEYEKFKSVYTIIGKSANYDNSGCLGSKEYIEGASIITRSLDGVLLQGRAVCAGYALALEKCLKYVGIEAKKISGIANNGKEEGQHAWNQVCIDGKWYNADLTWDYSKIQRGKPLEYCLVGDEMFNKEHKAREKVHRCNEDYLLSEVGVGTKRPYKPNFGKGVPILFGMQDYSNIAHETVIEQLILENIKKSQEQPKIQEENEK